MTDYYYEFDKQIQMNRLELLESEIIPFYLGKFESYVKENDGYLVLGRVSTRLTNDSSYQDVFHDSPI